MTATIIPIRDGTMAGDLNNPEPLVIAALELALEQARVGDLVGIGLIKVRSNGNVGNCWESPRNGHLLVAGCQYLMYDLLLALESKASDKGNP